MTKSPEQKAIEKQMRAQEKAERAARWVYFRVDLVIENLISEKR